MAVKQNIDVTMQDELHLLIFFGCVRCGETICSTGIANNYRYPMWFIEEPLVPVDEGYVCDACDKNYNHKGTKNTKIKKVQTI